MYKCKIISFTLIILIYSCVAPVNSAFESARMLKKGDVEIQGNSSVYLNSEPYLHDFENINNNIGGAISIGVSERYNIKLRYEAIIVSDNVYQFFDTSITISKVINYAEFGNKIKLIEEKIAFSLPVGFYFAGGDLAILLKPKLIFTPFCSQYFQLNIIPRLHVGIGEEFKFIPALNVGVGLSRNLNEWAIRPEIGWDGHVTGGVGFSYFIRKK